MIITVEGRNSQERNFIGCIVAQALKAASSKPVVSGQLDYAEAGEYTDNNLSPVIDDEITIVSEQSDTDTALMLDALNCKMQNGVCHFIFKKSDGTLRHAFGTLNAGLMPDKRSKYIADMLDTLHMGEAAMQAVLETINSGDIALMAENKKFFGQYLGLFKEITDKVTPKPKADRKANDTVQSYYDLEALDFRSFTKTNLLKVY